MVNAILLLTDGTYKRVEPAAPYDYQRLLGGYFEPLSTCRRDLCCYVREDRVGNLPPTLWAPLLSQLDFDFHGEIHGPAILCGLDRSDSELDLSLRVEMAVMAYYLDFLI
jgi:hypothetical protein